MKKNLFLILSLLITTQLVYTLSSDELFLGEDHEPGLVQLNDKDDMFYWLFRSRSQKETDPLVIWLTGGPGCSSEMAIFTENGPFTVNEDLSLKTNPNSWNNKANVIFIDQPIGNLLCSDIVGVGFSKGPITDWVFNENQVAENFYIFMTKFLESHPEYVNRPLFITGESYAGHYVPAITAYMHQQKNKDINLGGFAIGNGWVDPYVQYPQYAEFAYENKLIGVVQYQLLKGAFKLCQLAIKTGIWPIALELCQIELVTILGIPVIPFFNPYDIRKKCEHPPLCYDFSHVEKFLAREDVKEALGVKGRKWSSCNMGVHTFMLGDWMKDLSSQVKYLLENGVKGLVYSGDVDFVCNWRGGEAWTNALQWEHQSEFQNATYIDWSVNKKVAGQYKEAGNLVFLRVYQSGHMVPMDQPEAAVAMLDQFFGKWDQPQIQVEL